MCFARFPFFVVKTGKREAPPDEAPSAAGTTPDGDTSVDVPVLQPARIAMAAQMPKASRIEFEIRISVLTYSSLKCPGTEYAPAMHLPMSAVAPSPKQIAGQTRKGWGCQERSRDEPRLHCAGGTLRRLGCAYSVSVVNRRKVAIGQAAGVIEIAHTSWG